MERSIRLLTSIGTALLLAATTVATASAETEWHKAGPDGAQVRDGYSLAEAFADKGVWYSNFTPEPSGDSFIVLRTTLADDPGDWTTGIVRFVPGDDGRLTASDVLDLEQMRDPALWDADVDLDGATIRPGPRNGGTSPISVAPGGDLFVTVSADRDGMSLGSTLARVATDGSLHRVLSSDGLAAEGIFPAAVVSPWVSVVASGDDWLWGRAEGWDGATDHLTRLVQVVDPTADDDWSDRVVRPLVLPTSIPQVKDRVWDWVYGGFVPVAAVEGQDASRSVLLPLISRSGEYQVHRLTDLEGDGILDAEGDSELVFSGQFDAGSMDLMSPPSLAALPATLGSLAWTRLTQPSRVTVLEDGTMVDVVRGLFAPGSLASLEDGSLYVGSQGEGNGPAGQPYSILRLARGTAPDEAGVTAAAPAPTLAPPGEILVPRAPLSGDVPTIATWLGGTTSGGEWFEALLGYGADGSGPADLFPGLQVRSGACRSADGSQATVYAEVEVANEAPLALMDLVGGDPPRVLAENGGSVMCPFPPEALAMLWQDAIDARLDRIDLASGDLTALVERLPTGLWPSPSPDGRALALATGDGGTSLSIVDLVESTSRVLLEGLTGAVVRQAWSPDGRQLAIAVGPHDPLSPRPSGPMEVLVVDVAAGSSPRSLLGFDGPAPDLAWSPDGRSIAIKENDGEDDCCCGARGRLTVVDAQTGAARSVAPDASFAEWSPDDPGVLAWGSRTRLVIEQDGTARDITAPFVETDEGRKPAGWTGFMGWSLDGRYLGFNYPRLMTVDTQTDEARVIVSETDDLSLIDARWWQ